MSKDTAEGHPGPAEPLTGEPRAQLIDASASHRPSGRDALQEDEAESAIGISEVGENQVRHETRIWIEPDQPELLCILIDQSLPRLGNDEHHGLTEETRRELLHGGHR